jgi:FMN phosphatase YigB (HAD superfamily)
MGNPGKEEVLVVGDSLRSDILGGISYGVDTCWYNPRDNSNLTSHQPTYEINHLNELKKILLG